VEAATRRMGVAVRMEMTARRNCSRMSTSAGSWDDWSRRRRPRRGLEEAPPLDPDGIGGGAAADLREGRHRLLLRGRLEAAQVWKGPREA
jgi:hypothetical protein